MCEDMIDLDSLTELRRNEVINYFIENFINLILSSDFQDEEYKDFINDQKEFLLTAVQNITDATNTVKPEVKRALQSDDLITSISKFYTKLSDKVSSFFSYDNSKVDYEANDEIKIKIHQIINETYPNIKQEFESMLSIFRGDFYIEHTSKCKSSHNSREKDTE